MHPALPPCRDLLDRGDLDAIREAPFPWDPADSDPNPAAPAERAERWELLAFDALHKGFPSWAFACFRAGAAQAVAAGEGDLARDLVSRADRVLTLAFPPYEDDDGWVTDVRAWLAARRASDGPGALLDGLTAMRHRFALRALRTNRDGALLRFDRLAQRFDLPPDAALLLRVAIAVEASADRVLAGELIDWSMLDADHRARLRAELEPGAPLRRWGLLHLGDGPSLDRRPIGVDESVLATLDGRAPWPEALRGRARQLPQPGADLAYRDVARGALLRWWQGRPAATWLVVGGCSGPEAAHAVVAGLATVDAPVITVGPGAPTPDATVACAREARLRRAVVWIPAESRAWAVALADLARDLPIAVAAHVSATHNLDVPLSFLHAGLPDPDERARLVNEALADAGRPALAPRALAAALAPLPVGVADLALAVRAALTDPAERLTPSRIAELVRARLA
jgi:hypothetical protein